MDYEDFSPKEQLQLTVCQRLIAEKELIFPKRSSAATYRSVVLRQSASPPFLVCSSC